MLKLLHGYHLCEPSKPHIVHSDFCEFQFDPSTKTVRKTRASLIPNELSARMFDIENSLSRGDNQDIVTTPYLHPTLEQMDFIVRSAVSDIEDAQINIELDLSKASSQKQTQPIVEPTKTE